MNHVDNIPLRIPSPIEKIKHPIISERKVELFVKREDLIHKLISGNKWRKLKYVLEEIKSKSYHQALTFGGAYSNHIFSFAYACKLVDVKGVVIVRGEESNPLNPTLQFVTSCGVDIHYVSRSEYRLKENSVPVKAIINQYSSPYIIPEGGSTPFAYQGIGEMAKEVLEHPVKPDYVAISAGTGCTAGCMIHALSGSGIYTEVFSALKGGFMVNDVRAWAGKDEDFQVLIDYHCGGYAKVNLELINFINEFSLSTQIPIDPIYNGKLVFGLIERINNYVYPPGTKILWVHTGGLQGIPGFNLRWKGKYHIGLQ